MQIGFIKVVESSFRLFFKVDNETTVEYISSRRLSSGVWDADSAEIIFVITFFSRLAQKWLQVKYYPSRRVGVCVFANQHNARPSRVGEIINFLWRVRDLSPGRNFLLSRKIFLLFPFFSSLSISRKKRFARRWCKDDKDFARETRSMKAARDPAAMLNCMRER